MEWESHMRCGFDMELEYCRDGDSSMDACNPFDEMPACGFEEWREPSRVLEVTIHYARYPITERLICQVFGPSIVVEEMYVCKELERVEARLLFPSRLQAAEAFGVFHGRNIYDGCCQMIIKWGAFQEHATAADMISITRTSSSSMPLHACAVSTISDETTTSPGLTAATASDINTINKHCNEKVIFDEGPIYDDENVFYEEPVFVEEPSDIILDINFGDAASVSLLAAGVSKGIPPPVEALEVAPPKSSLNSASSVSPAYNMAGSRPSDTTATYISVVLSNGPDIILDADLPSYGIPVVLGTRCDARDKGAGNAKLILIKAPWSLDGFSPWNSLNRLVIVEMLVWCHGGFSPGLCAELHVAVVMVWDPGIYSDDIILKFTARWYFGLPRKPPWLTLGDRGTERQIIQRSKGVVVMHLLLQVTSEQMVVLSLEKGNSSQVFVLWPTPGSFIMCHQSGVHLECGELVQDGACKWELISGVIKPLPPWPSSVIYNFRIMHVALARINSLANYYILRKCCVVKAMEDCPGC